jgi:hypothetical protein
VSLIGHLTTGWPRTLPLNQHAVVAYTTRRPDDTLTVTIDFEDDEPQSDSDLNQHPKRAKKLAAVSDI